MPGLNWKKIVPVMVVGLNSWAWGMPPFELPRETQKELHEAQETGAKISENKPLSVTSDLRLVDVMVEDEDGRPVQGLYKWDFIVNDSQDETITHFWVERLPLAVALVVDTSVNQRIGAGLMRNAARTALQSLKTADQVVMFMFSSSKEQIIKRAKVGLTKDRQIINDLITGIHGDLNSSGSDIGMAVFSAAEYLKQHAPNSRRMIILVSQNNAARGQYCQKDILRELMTDGISLFSMKLPGPPQGDINVKDIVRQTGGKMWAASTFSREEFRMGLTAAVLQLTPSIYTIGYYPNSLTPNSSEIAVYVRPKQCGLLKMRINNVSLALANGRRIDWKILDGDSKITCKAAARVTVLDANVKESN